MPALLVFDYIETHVEFPAVVQHIEEICDNTGLRIRYVATCRATYYGGIAALGHHEHIALSEPANPQVEAWLSSYRRAAVRHILGNAGLADSERHIVACHDLPVLAAFLHWLHGNHRIEELDELITEKEFGTWVIKRLKATFPQRSVDRTLARLVALLPMPEQSISELDEDERAIFERMATDGWIERAEDPVAGIAAWHAAHDVLADRGPRMVERVRRKGDGSPVAHGDSAGSNPPRLPLIIAAFS